MNVLRAQKVFALGRRRPNNAGDSAILVVYSVRKPARGFGGVHKNFVRSLNGEGRRSGQRRTKLRLKASALTEALVNG